MVELHTRTLPETKIAPEIFNGWKMIFLLTWALFRGYVSFGECICCEDVQKIGESQWSC